MILSCGDALIDFVPVAAADGNEAVRPMVGGSCLNVAVGLARLGAPAGFVGGISTDLFGRMIGEHACASGVDLTYATRSDHQTTLAFVRMAAGESQYAFYDAGTASRAWAYQRGKIPFEAVAAVHIGSTTLVNERGAAETAAMIADARRSATISFDPNCRPNLVKDKKAYLDRMSVFAGSADVIRMSDVDFDYLYGEATYGDKAASLFAGGCGLFAITRGVKGPKRGIQRPERSRSMHLRSKWSIVSAQATAFRRRFYLRCTSWAGSTGPGLLTPARMSFVMRFPSRAAVRR